jgi:hypothetical protein
VSRVVRVRLAEAVKIVQLDLFEQERTMIRPDANNVNWVKQQRLKVLLNATRAMLEHLAAAKAFVPLALLVFIKSTKAKHTASNVHWENRTSMSKQHAVIVTRVNLVVAMAFVQHARLGSFKIPKVKNTAATLVPHRAKNPTTKAPGVNCHRGVPA